MRFITFADTHIYDTESAEHVVSLLKNAIEKHHPDLIIGLGDTFNNQETCTQYAPLLNDMLHNLSIHSLLIYGNHDGGTSRGKKLDGWKTFTATFGDPQRTETINGQKFIMLGDMQENSDWEKFALDNTQPGSIILSHAPLKQNLIDQLANLGAIALFSGHTHRSHIQHSTNKDAIQYTLPPLTFGGACYDQPSYGIADTDKHHIKFHLEPCKIPHTTYNTNIYQNATPPSPQPPQDSHFQNNPDDWITTYPLKVDKREWLGDGQHLQYRIDNTIVWDKSYGRGMRGCFTSQLIKENDTEFLIIGGTWLVAKESAKFESIIVINPDTGAEYYRAEVVGVSCAPAYKDGIIYIVGQWREIIAVELASGKELWRQRSQIKNEQSKKLSWKDSQIGGGWSTTPAIVENHVWTINARGDLFGYDPKTGKEKFTYPAAIPLNKNRVAPYASTLSCVPSRWEKETIDNKTYFTINGIRIDDTSGKICENG